MRKFLLPLLFLFVHSFFGQNLVENGSFEDRSDCPNGFTHLTLAYGWDNPNGGTADLFCDCHGKKWNCAGAPENQFGTQEAEDGACYVGMMCHTFGDNRKEYIRCSLKEKLEKKKKYCLTFYYSPADMMKIDVKTLGFLVSSKKNDIKNYGVYTEATANLKITSDRAAWNKFAVSFEAKGGEKYLTIGSFEDENNFKEVHGATVPERGNKFYSNYMAYYFVDDVSLVETNDPASCKCNDDVAAEEIETKQEEPKEEPVATTKIEKTFVLKNLNFETNKSEILENSFSELDSLAEYLNSETRLNLKIEGHTDNVGSEIKNLELSKNRALAVLNYLSQKGISRERMVYEGYGSSKPVASNETNEGRMENRRVEISFWKN